MSRVQKGNNYKMKFYLTECSKNESPAFQSMMQYFYDIALNNLQQEKIKFNDFRLLEQTLLHLQIKYHKKEEQKIVIERL